MSHLAQHARRFTILAASAMILSFIPATAATTPAQAVDRPAIQPLPADLETIRAREATALYGSPGIRPIESRQTGLITMGDSEISGEGVGNYVPGTHTDGPPMNYCDRSYDQAIFKVGIAADQKFNIACSGGQPNDLVYGGSTQWNELNQGNNLAIKARNTRLKLVWIVVGANGAGNIEFGPVATDCVERRVFFRGVCWPTYTDDWARRVEGSRTSVTRAVNDVKQTMANAGYLRSDYELVVMSYPSPGSPDVEDNPDFPGWYDGGCLMYLADVAFARNKAVPMFETAIQSAAEATGARYLDASRLFAGHAVCDQTPWVRGLYVENGDISDPNMMRQSFHPNARGHVAFASCMTAFWNSGSAQATCVDPASTNATALYPGLMEFKDLRHSSGKCLDAHGYDSRNGANLEAYNCHGGRNQGFWYDSSRQSLHVELSHDRCVDARGSVTAGTRAILYDCHGGANQKWVFNGATIRPAANTGLCLTLANANNGTDATLAACNGSASQSWSMAKRSYATPAGYGYDDFIGDSVY